MAPVKTLEQTLKETKNTKKQQKIKKLYQKQPLKPIPFNLVTVASSANSFNALAEDCSMTEAAEESEGEGEGVVTPTPTCQQLQPTTPTTTTTTTTTPTTAWKVSTEQDISLHIAVGIEAFTAALSASTDKKMKTALTELLVHAAAVQEGRLLCSYAANQELTREIQAIKLEISQQRQSLIQAPLKQQPEKAKAPKSYAQAASSLTAAVSTAASQVQAQALKPVKLTIKQRKEELQKRQLVVITTTTDKPSLDTL